MNSSEILTQEMLAEMAHSFKNSPLAQQQSDNARHKMAKNRAWLTEISQKLNESFGNVTIAKTSNLLVITPDFMTKMIQSLQTSEVYKNKLANAKAHLEQIKPQLERLISSKPTQSETKSVL